MTDFSKILDKAKELEMKMKESQEKIKEIRAEGVSGSNSVKDNPKWRRRNAINKIIR